LGAHCRPRPTIENGWGRGLNAVVDLANPLKGGDAKPPVSRVFEP
jgi:hypothetical protein